MRIEKEFKKSGFFWLPDNPDKKSPGILNIAEGGKIELEILDHLEDGLAAFNNNIDIGRIIGHIEDKGYVTLNTCWYKNKNYNSSGISKSLIYVSSALIGVAYEKDEEVKLNTIQFTTEGLLEWINISGIETFHYNDNKSSCYQFSPPDPLIYHLDNGLDLTITFTHTRPIGLSIRNLHITQDAFIKISSTDAFTLEFAIDFLHKLANLICFACNSITSVRKIYYNSDDIVETKSDGTERPVLIELFYESRPYSLKPFNYKLHNILFSFSKVKENFSQVVNNWLDSYKINSPAFNLYFANKSGAHQYIDSQFLTYSQAMETFHKRASNNTFSQNKSTLRARITDLFKKFEKYFGSEEEINTLIEKIVTTRNYYTHYDLNLEKKAVVEGGDLWDIVIKMDTLLQLHFLTIIGFDETSIDELINKNYRLRQNLNYKI